MITEQNIEEMYSDYCYGIYYRKPTNWDREEQRQAKLADMAHEDSIFEEEN